MAEPSEEHGPEPIVVMPVVVLSQIFPARPSSIPDIRQFVRRCLAESPLTEEGTREVGETVFRALLDAAGPTGSINVAFRIFPEHVEVDVLHSDVPIGSDGTGMAASGGQPGGTALGGTAPGGAGLGQGAAGGRRAAGQAEPAAAAHGGRGAAPASPVLLGQPGQPATFAEWMQTALRRQGLTQEAAARQLGVSVKTIGRWVGGATEPRMRDLRRIQEVFGVLPLP